ncbi:flavin reductase family protein [Ktedonospora formicarum]|uniref:Flavin reductase like domain-containing protein n=1 Tax=Ktedonospora formicarum TaxID=2778364 RepID=A0A8J3MWE9_9CHLR|nr:flavin reductase family protein [Ktedonospora formicarum]GHO50275.1 hypothetical protein KSX_84380 [Ktedonospora formicarum]
MALEKSFFRQVMGRFTTGVTVVTTRHNELLGGLTVNAFCSVSLDPPLVLVCVDLHSQTLPLIRGGKNFAVNMLTEQQQDLSNCFSTTTPERLNYFSHAPYHTAATGAPILDQTLAFIDARVVAEYPGGDHAIFLGQVEAMGNGTRTMYANPEGSNHHVTFTEVSQNGTNAHNEPEPLLYYLGQYRELGSIQPKPSLTGIAHEDGAK